ncbi:glycosyl transferase family protein [Croceicoccus hydrothermalis]|uniref:glycosyl transferase family protein n=1 Tax=Croceicoccus hydrothermalis TaxID=2867964 RepID=UPI001EFC01AC|nr:glycosyl transferase family protein [Croceicoccus hydrothermalis]
MWVAETGWVAAFFAGVDAIRLELLLFAGFWFCVGALDELLVDGVWAGLHLSGKARTPVLDAPLRTELSQPIALYVPAWREARVIGTMLSHCLRTWPHRDLRVYVGCYPNDPATARAIAPIAKADRRVRPVVVGHDGPTTKGDCLNAIWHAMVRDEIASVRQYRAILLQDAEDMVHPDALSLMDEALDNADFVQLPVRPEPQSRSTWIAGHYTDEFTEAHLREMIVRDRLGAGIPAAGVGCAFSRAALARTMERDGRTAPFTPDALTEDYELGMKIGRAPRARPARANSNVDDGGKGGRFIRVRAADGTLIATRSPFPHRLDAAVRQKARWLQGIAFDGWDTLGWASHPFELWMRMRDRRGPLVAIVLAAAYLAFVLTGVLGAAQWLGWYDVRELPGVVGWMLVITTAAFAWRALVRAAVVTREYGWEEGFAAVVRIPVANMIAIIAARLALVRYTRSLRGEPTRWEKTEHDFHPAEHAT